MHLGRNLHRKLVACLAVCVLLHGCKSQSNLLHGYIEAKPTYIASPISGRLMSLLVERGAEVKKNQPLYTLESMPEASDQAAAQQRLAQSRARLADLQKGLRQSELEAIEAQIKETEANIDYLKKQLVRSKVLVARSAIQKEALDKAQADLATRQEQLRQRQANLVTAKLGARLDQINAQAHQVAIEQQQLAKASWAVDQKAMPSPITATVFDTFYRVGEVVPANHPVLSLLADKDIKVVFFIPETQLDNIRLHQTIKITCDECQRHLHASIEFISPVAEFTPPVIYSNSARSKLVFRVEAGLDAASRQKIHPGQPVDIDLTAG